MTHRIPKSLLLSLLAPGALAIDPPNAGNATPAGPSTIALAWSGAAPEATGFRIYRDGSPVADLEATAGHYYDRGLSPESTHSYQVTALDGTTESAPLVLGSATTTLRMNLLFFLADDMGYKDIVALRNPAVDGPTIYETPTLDTLAGQSLVVTNAYCSGPKCVVARRSLQTGKYDWRPEAVPDNNWYVDHNGDPIGGGLWAGGTTVAGSKQGPGQTIPYDNLTYGEALKAGGYRTGFIGKYHLGESTPQRHAPAGYAFGDQPGRGPADQGYDVSIGAGHAGAPPASYFAQENQNSPGVTDYTFELPDLDDTAFMLDPAAPAAGDYIGDRLTDKAIGFIDDAITQHPSAPFCLTLAHYLVHTPAEAKPTDIDHFKARKAAMAAALATHPMAATPLVADSGSYARQVQDNVVYAAMMKNYDDSLAELRAYLAATDDPRHPGRKLSETTILVVSSDHGGKSTLALSDNRPLEDDSTDEVNLDPVWTGSSYRSAFGNTYSFYPTSNYPYRHGKTWVYEGGLKIPLIVHYPGLTTASFSSAFVHQADFFATFCDMAGIVPPAEATDSLSFMLSAGQPDAAARDESHHFFTNASPGTGNPAMGAYRRGDHKLIYFMVQRRLELYHLAADPYERNDLSSSRPDLAAEMFDALYQQVVSTGEKMPLPGSNSWRSEQEVLVANAVVGALPDPPDAAPSGLTLTQLSPTAIQLDWNVNATNATHSVIYRSGPDERALNGGSDFYREVAWVPVGTTTWIDTRFPSIDGEKYKYRVQSENLGGWTGYVIDPGGLFSDRPDGYSESSITTSTGNEILTLSTALPPLACDARDDAITVIPGETRRFLPLRNDAGEGALTLTAITAPGAGSAFIDGEAIVFEAPESFVGGVTLTYTITDGAAQSDSATVTFILPLAPSDEVVEQWDFDDAAGTQLENATSLNGTVFTGSTSDKVATNGAGQLLLQQDTTNHFRTSTTLPGTPFTTGRFALEIEVDSIDLTNSENGANFGFSLRDSQDIDFGNIRLRKNAGTLVLENRIGSSNERLYDFNQGGPAVTQASDLLIVAVLDLDARTWSGTLTIGGGAPIVLPAFAADPTATGGLALTRFQGNQDGANWASGDTALIERVTIRRLTGEVSLYEQWSTGYPWNGELNTLPGDDPDGDGLVNFLEFALGTPATQAGPAPVVVGDFGTGPALRFTPVRDTSVVRYFVERSLDLADWTSLPPVEVTTPAGSLVEIPLPAGSQGFGRIGAQAEAP